MNSLDLILLGRHFLRREHTCVFSDLPSNDSNGDTKWDRSIYARSNDLRELDRVSRGERKTRRDFEYRSCRAIDLRNRANVAAQRTWIYIAERFE